MQKILMVCLGNICRSPLAEGILREKTNQLGISVFIDSAGTSNYHIGEHPDKRTVANAFKHGVDISKLKGRQFTQEDFDQFDTIFVMDSSNYTNVIALARDEKDIKKVELILNRLYPNENRAVPDPYFGGEQGFEDVFVLLDRVCTQIASTLIKS
ncbi:MAG: low molecular weight phosphotyrosine protein phosphatase [Bacteroidetes bacterium]|nr:low molecular weight phosphotyrosine protein phosphatase [Bacteroidota bacterium]